MPNNLNILLSQPRHPSWPAIRRRVATIRRALARNPDYLDYTNRHRVYINNQSVTPKYGRIRRAVQYASELPRLVFIFPYA